MTKQSMDLATVVCDCGRRHFVVFTSEMLVCQCKRLIEVAGEQYANLDPDETHSFIDDIKGWIEGQADNTHRPPGFDKNRSDL